MGSAGEAETTHFLKDFLKKQALQPYAEEFSWSTAFVSGRKYLYMLLGVFAILFNISLRLAPPLNSVLAILLVVAAISMVVFGMKGLLHDKFKKLGKSFQAENVLCDIPSRSKAEDTPLIYFTAHYDSISSNHPKLNNLSMITLLLGFVLSMLLTLTSAILNLVDHYQPAWNGQPTIHTINWIILITSLVVLGMAIFSLFIKRTNNSPGACDNGSGSAILLSLAAHFQQQPPANTRLRFLWCGAEEWGLYGSKGYVKAHREEIAAQRGRSCVINVDMVGSELAYLQKSGFLFQKPLNKPLNDLIAECAQEANITARPFNSVIGGNSDHAAFQKEKMAVCFFLANKDTKIIHSPQDTIEKVKPEKLADAVELIKRMVAKLDKQFL
ncbi:MAG: Zn-dependent exopeptidase M28, partial [Chloroflexi bacterium]|nr:Zn-dependent exopeptidase M28 [Chloroflexota bacterium]